MGQNRENRESFCPRKFLPLKYIDLNDEIAFYFRTLPQSSFLGNGCTQTLFKHILGIYIKKKHAHMIQFSLLTFG